MNTHKSTMALDVATVWRALGELESKFFGATQIWDWNAYNPTQDVLFRLRKLFGSHVGGLKNLLGKASTDWIVLNDFLIDRGHEPIFTGPLDGIGAVSCLDMSIKWLHPAHLVDIYCGDNRSHTGFEIPVDGRKIHMLGDRPVVQLAICVAAIARICKISVRIVLSPPQVHSLYIPFYSRKC